MRFVIALRPRDYTLPRWLLRLYAAGFALWFGLLGVCILILLYAVVSITFGV